MSAAESLRRYFIDYPDFPKPGIIFKDIMPLYASPEGRQLLCELFTQLVKSSEIDVIVGIESRGFVLATLLAECWQKRMVLVRKQGKLPGDLNAVSYDLEYGEATLEIQTGALSKAERVLIVDDLLATGGTLMAAAQLVEGLGGIVDTLAIVAELAALPGREKLAGYRVESLVTL